MEKTDNAEQQPLRRANLLQIVKNLFDYHQKYLEKEKYRIATPEIGKLFSV